MKPAPHRIKSARAIPPASLEITWADGGGDIIDMTGAIALATPPMKPLNDPEVFAAAKAEEWGWSVEWPHDISIGGDTLLEMAVAQRPWGSDDFKQWQSRVKLSNAEAADVLGASKSTIEKYRAGGNLSRAVRFTCQALATNRVLLSALYRPRATGRPRKTTATEATAPTPKRD